MAKNNLTTSSGVSAVADSGYNGALGFNGSAYAVPANPVLNAFAAGSSFTVRKRFKTSSTSGFMALINATGGAGGTTNNVLVSVDAGALVVNVAGFNGGGASGNLGATGAGAACNDGAEHLVELAVGPSSLYLFLDGLLVGSVTSGSYAPTLTGSLFEAVGAYCGSGTTQNPGPAAGVGNFTGSIGHVEVYNTQLHAAAYTPPTAPTANTAAGLVAYWRCEAGTISGTTVLDCAGATIALSPTSGASGQAVAVAGTNTQWNTIAPTFAITGDATSGSAHTSDAAGSFTLATNTATGAQVVTDPTSGATAAFTVQAQGVTPPSPPTLSTPTASGSNLAISYTAPAKGTNNVTAVSLYQGTSPGGEGSTAVATNSSPAAGSFTVPAPAAGQTAYYVAKATDGTAPSAASNEVSYTTPTPPTLSVSGPSFAAEGVASTAFTVTLSAAQGSPVAVNVAHSLAGVTTTPPTPTIAAGQASTTFTVEGTTPGSDTVTLSAAGLASVAAAFTVLDPSAVLVPVVAAYGVDYAGLAGSLGVTVYGSGGTVLLPRTTGLGAECPAGSGNYLFLVPVESSWAGAIGVDAPAGLVGEFVALRPGSSGSGGSGTAGQSGDPWSTALPGGYSPGSAGYILGTYLNATVSSRSTFVGPSGFSSVVCANGGINLNLGQSLTPAVRDQTTVTPATATIGDSLAAAWGDATGPESRPNTPGPTPYTKKYNDGTQLRLFSLDSGTSPTTRS